jgi:predicted nucleotide-binding protein
MSVPNLHIQKLKDFKNLFSDLSALDKKGFDNLIKRTSIVIDHSYDLHPNYKTELLELNQQVQNQKRGALDFVDKILWNGTINSVLGVFDRILDEIELKELNQTSIQSKENKNTGSNLKIFVVHGHNEEIKQHVARVLEKLNLKPIILHEQANEGKTVIEKFSSHSGVNFAVVILSGDDIGASKKQNKELKFRARQNVVFELGFFLGKLGREKVVVLHETIDNFEFPSDYNGVIYLPYDPNQGWYFALARELKKAGYDIDLNKLSE